MEATRIGLAAILAGVLLLGVQPAHGDDVTIAGRKLLMRDFTTPGTADRKVAAAAKGGAIVVPTPGGAGDPTLFGGSVVVANSSGSGESMSLSLPADRWVQRRSGWKYREEVSDPPNDDFKILAVLKTGRLKIVVRDEVGSLIDYTLDEASQGSVAVQLVTGADRHCLDFGGTVKRDESVDLGGSVYRGVFAAKEADAPEDCDGSPSGAFLD